MNLWRFLLQFFCLVVICLFIVIQSVSAACEYNITEENKLYNYNLAAPSKKFPHGVRSEDGHYKVSSNGTVVWFQLCDSMIFNHNPPRCFDCFECGRSSRCGMNCSALVSIDMLGYPVCYTMGHTETTITDLIDKNRPQKGLMFKMMYKDPQKNCSLSVSVVCDSKQVQGPQTLERVGFCSYTTQLRHPSGCAIIASAKSNGLGWFTIFLIIILCLLGSYLIAGATYRFFYLDIRGIDIIPNLEFWNSLPHKAQSAFMSLVGRFRGRSEVDQTYSPIDS